MNTPSRTQPAPRDPTHMRAWIGLAVLALPTFLLGLDVTLLYLALPALAADLQPGSTEALWIMDIYGFMIAGFLITMGALGDRIGRRRLLMIGAAAFGIASVIAAFSTHASTLILARAALGIAGATLMPSTLALISNLFPHPRERALAIGIWATMFALGMAAGPVVGGLVLAHFWWGAAFLVAIPIITVLLIATPRLLPEYRARSAGRIDLTSVLLSLGAILPVIYAIKEMAKAGPNVLLVLTGLAGLLIGVMFVRRQRRLTHPLVDLTLFSSATFNAALLVLLLGLIGVAGMMLLVTQYLQLVAALPPLKAGLWMGPPALMMVLAGVLSPVVARRVPPGLVVSGALAISVTGYGLLAWLPRDAIGIAVTGFGLVYFGLGALAALGTALVVGSAPESRAGAASALSEMAQELGVALGVALLGSLATLAYREHIAAMIHSLARAEPAETASHDALQDSLWSASSFHPPLPDDVLLSAQDAFMHSLQFTALVAGIGVAALAVLAAVALRHVPTLDDERS